MHALRRSALVLGIGLVSAVPATQAQAARVTSLAPWSASSTYLAKDDIDGRAAPKLEPRAKTNAVRKGDWVKITCQVEGEAAYGSNLWAKVGDYYVPDQLLKTYSDGRLQGAPRCGGSGANPAPAPKPAPAPAAKCHDVTVYGVRGSGEPSKGNRGMGATVGPTAAVVKKALPKGRSVQLVGVPYPASPVSLLTRDPAAFQASMTLGQTVLRELILKRTAACPRTKVVAIGYSQGAGVVSETMRSLKKAVLRRVRVVALFADTYSAGGTSYAQSFTYSNPDAALVKRSGHGIFGKRRLPAAIRTKIDVCFREDLICNSGSTGRNAAQAFFVRSHTSYKTWSPSFFGSLTELIGVMAAKNVGR